WAKLRESIPRRFALSRTMMAENIVNGSQKRRNTWWWKGAIGPVIGPSDSRRAAVMTPPATRANQIVHLRRRALDLALVSVKTVSCA
ncbi:MAG TPA: hypothetical protein VI893_04090, partial [Thermoplasmata archaeon]|nr:hypothetical protein [Thermoplasmata archaeon]